MEIEDGEFDGDDFLELKGKKKLKLKKKNPENPEEIFDAQIDAALLQEKEMTEDEMIEKLETLEIPKNIFTIPTEEETKYINDMAEEIVKSNFFGEKNPFSAKIKVRACLSLKIDPTLFYNDIQIMDFKGKKVLTQSAYLMGFEILRSFPYAIKQQGWGGKGDDYGFKMLVQRPGRPARPFTFTLKDAANAKLLWKDGNNKWHAINDNWFKYMKDMLRSRCYTQCARTEFQDLLGGIIYAPEDFNQHIEAEE